MNNQDDLSYVRGPRFETTFPNGCQLIQTSSKGLEAGILALHYSIEYQTDLPVPKTDELASLSWEALPRDSFDQNLSAGHLAAILEKYGRKIGQHLQLGIYEKIGRYWIIPGRHASPDVMTIWINRDNGHDEGGGNLRHYSGLRRSDVDVLLSGKMPSNHDLNLPQTP